MALLGMLAAAPLVAGCQSTQEKSAALAKEGTAAFEAKGLEVGKASRDVEVLARAVLSDENGAAAVAVLKNTSKRTLVDVPVSIDVTGAGGKSLFENGDPGIEPSLAGLSVMKPGETIFWTNDQVFATDTPRSVAVRAGRDKGGAPARLPEIEVQSAKLEVDQTSGVVAVGKVVNKSGLLQRKLVIFGVARKGEEIVAAGRGQIERLNPGKDATYQIFFIGNPRGAKLELAAPPTALE